MTYRRGDIGIAIFTAAYLAAFAPLFIAARNWEFLLYAGVVAVVLVILLATLRRIRLSYAVLGGLSLWGLMHMAGGSVVVDDDVLYALRIIPIVDRGDELFILKFDQVVHFWGFGVTTLLAYDLLCPSLEVKPNYGVIYPVLVLVGMGFGALNEIIEFIAVMACPQTGVGGYVNTSLDMVFNMLGAMTAAIYIHVRRVSGGD